MAVQVNLNLKHTWHPDLIESWCWGWAHSQCYTHKGITMETISISHHDDTCDGHYGCHNLQVEVQRHQCYHSEARWLTTEKIICNFRCFYTNPNTHEPILQDNPWQEKHKGFVAAVESGDISGGQFLQGEEVQVVCQRRQDWERCCPLYKKLESHPILPKELTAFPVRESKGSPVIRSFPLGALCLFVSFYQEDHASRMEMLVA